MLKRKIIYFSVDENIWEALFVFEKLEALIAASSEPVFRTEESKCLTWEMQDSACDLVWSGLVDGTASQRDLCVCVSSIQCLNLYEKKGIWKLKNGNKIEKCRNEKLFDSPLMKTFGKHRSSLKISRHSKLHRRNLLSELKNQNVWHENCKPLPGICYDQCW